MILWIISCLVGLSINLIRSHPLHWSYHDPDERRELFVLEHKNAMAVPSEPISPATQIVRLDMAEFLNYFERGDILLLDARPALLFENGHIPGAMNLSRGRFESDYKSIEDKLLEFSNKPVVIYCADSDCEDSGVVAESLKALSFNTVLLFEGGWAAWEELGLQAVYDDESAWTNDEGRTP